MADAPAEPPDSALSYGTGERGAVKLQRIVWATIIGCVLSIAAVATAGAHEDHGTSQWPTTCIDLNDVVETHLGNLGNVGIYQRTFGDQAEAACQNDHREDVRGVFAWAFDDASQSIRSDLPDLAWPRTCVELNDIVEGHVGNFGNVGIYQRVFSDQAEPACRNDHREDVRGVFAWAFAGSAPTEAPAATPVPLSRLAFVSVRDMNTDIYLINTDGTGIRRLTHHPNLDAPTDWSPDRKRIAFHSNRDGDYEVYIMNADGTGLTQVTHNSALAPIWSPVGRRLAFTSDRDGDWEIYLMDTDGTDVVQLTHNSARDLGAFWSPDGRRLVFTSDRDGDWEVYVMNTDGSGLVQLTHNSALDAARPWSPDGRRIVFTSDRDGDQEIYLINPDGTGLVQLTDNIDRDFNPDWSPDGHHIAFASDRDRDLEIYIMNADGTGITQVTHNTARDLAPVW